MKMFQNSLDATVLAMVERHVLSLLTTKCPRDLERSKTHPDFAHGVESSSVMTEEEERRKGGGGVEGGDGPDNAADVEGVELRLSMVLRGEPRRCAMV